MSKNVALFTRRQLGIRVADRIKQLEGINEALERGFNQVVTQFIALVQREHDGEAMISEVDLAMAKGRRLAVRIETAPDSVTGLPVKVMRFTAEDIPPEEAAIGQPDVPELPPEAATPPVPPELPDNESSEEFLARLRRGE